jgi:hypothetical protein
MTSSRLRSRLLGAAYCAACVLAGVLAGLAVLSAVRTASETVERREELESMPPAEQLQLVRRQERFQRLDAERKERLRDLQEQLDSSADEEELRSVMQQYYDWLGSLDAVDQAELLELSADMEKRIERVKQIQAEQRRYRPFSESDVKFAAGWIEERLEGKLSPDEQMKLTSAEAPEHRRLEALRIAQKKWGGWGAPNPAADAGQFASEENFQALTAGVGPIPRQIILDMRARSEKFNQRDGLRITMQTAVGMLAHEALRQSMQRDLKQQGMTKADLWGYFRSELEEKLKNNIRQAPQPWFREFLIQYYFLHSKFPERYPEAMPFRFGRRGGGPRPETPGRPEGGRPEPQGGAGDRPGGGGPGGGGAGGGGPRRPGDVGPREGRGIL